MKRLISITTLATLAYLFVAGQALSAGNQNSGVGALGAHQSSGMMNEGQRQGMMNEGQRQGMMGVNLNREQIREAQRLLNECGIKAGAADGIYGTQTRTAIREFQQSQKLAVTGTLDDPTLRALAPKTKQQEFFGLSPAYAKPGSKTMGDQAEPITE